MLTISPLHFILTAGGFAKVLLQFFKTNHAQYTQSLSDVYIYTVGMDGCQTFGFLR